MSERQLIEQLKQGNEPAFRWLVENFILVDKQRRIRGVYNGTLALEMERLADDINTLLKEKE